MWGVGQSPAKTKKERVFMDNRIHLFRYKDKNILLDVESSSLHVVDDETAKILEDFNGENDKVIIEKYGENSKEILEELHYLINENTLFAKSLKLPENYRPEGVVKSLCLIIAEDCNLACKYCFAGGDYGNVSREKMSPEVAKKAVDFLLKTSPQRQNYEIDFFGGEPLLNMETLEKVTAYVRQKEAETGKKIKLTLTTNGVLLSDKIIDWLNKNNISVVLSLDGRKEVHDAMRKDKGGNNTYDKILPKFKKLVNSRNGENYYLRGTYTAKNLDFCKDILSMYDENFRILSLEPVVSKDENLSIKKEDLPQIFAEYDKLTDLYLEKKSQNDPFNFFHFNIDLTGGPCLHKRVSACGAGHEYYAVATNGDLFPCHQFVGKSEYKLGTIFDEKMTSNLPQKFRNAHIFNKPKCQNCFAKYFCSGGCHANNINMNGDILEPYEVGCEIMKKRVECALYLAACALG